MALQRSKQLNPRLTGSFTISGSFIGDSASTGSFALVSGSSTSTGSFGTLKAGADINAEGRIFEQGSSVIDHATAMAIVFGG